MLIAARSSSIGTTTAWPCLSSSENPIVTWLGVLVTAVARRWNVGGTGVAVGVGVGVGVASGVAVGSGVGVGVAVKTMEG